MAVWFLEAPRLEVLIQAPFFAEVPPALDPATRVVVLGVQPPVVVVAAVALATVVPLQPFALRELANIFPNQKTCAMGWKSRAIGRDLLVRDGAGAGQGEKMRAAQRQRRLPLLEVSGLPVLVARAPPPLPPRAIPLPLSHSPSVCAPTRPPRFLAPRSPRSSSDHSGKIRIPAPPCRFSLFFFFFFFRDLFGSRSIDRDRPG